MYSLTMHITHWQLAHRASAAHYTELHELSEFSHFVKGFPYPTKKYRFHRKDVARRNDIMSKLIKIRSSASHTHEIPYH